MHLAVRWAALGAPGPTGSSLLLQLASKGQGLQQIVRWATSYHRILRMIITALHMFRHWSMQLPRYLIRRAQDH